MACPRGQTAWYCADRPAGPLFVPRVHPLPARGLCQGTSSKLSFPFVTGSGYPPTSQDRPGVGETADAKPPCAHAVPGPWQMLTDSARFHPRPDDALWPTPPSLVRTWPGGVVRQRRPTPVQGSAARADCVSEGTRPPPSCHACRPLSAGAVRSHLAVRARHGLVEGSLQLNLIGSFSAAHKSVCSAEVPGRPGRSHC